MIHHKVFFITLLCVVCCFWFFSTMTFDSVHLGEDSVPEIKQKEIHEIPNSSTKNISPIRQYHSSASFIRKKREVKESEENISPTKGRIIPSKEIIKSSQQIEFTPAFYGLPTSVNSYQMTGQQQFALPQYTVQPQNDAAAFVPTFSQFQQSQMQQPIMHLQIGSYNEMMQPVCFMNQGNPPYPNAEPFYCTYIPVPPTYQFPVVPGITDFNQAMLQTKKGSGEQEDIVKAQFANPFEHIFKEYMRECPAGFYRCNDGSKCIAKLQWCDNFVDCADASDETKCSCRDRIERERLCDNYLDCPHGEDELGCFGCPKSSFSCNDSSISLYNKGSCILQEQRCDGIRQCANNKDEQLCSTLTESYTSGNEIFPVGYNLGFLRRNLRGQWYPVCGRAYSWANDACVAALGFISKEPQIEMVVLPNSYEVGPFLMEDGYLGKVVPDCPKEITYVRCPGPYSISSPDQQEDESSFYLSSGRNAGSNSGPMVSIVGGHDSLPGAWPFIVAINKNGYFHCGGVVLNEWWVLSAAHCFTDFQRQYYEIDAGTLRRFSYSPAQQTRRLDGVIIHPNYDAVILKNDIALGLLSEPLFFNGWVRPVRLPTDASDAQLFRWRQTPSPGDICVAVGWGATREGGTDPDHLREVEVPIIDCKYLEDRNSAEICAGLKQGGRDACQGDSGGPLMCRMRESNSGWYVGGIVSHGIGCGRQNEPGAYTKVSHFVEWINKVIDGGKAPSALKRTRNLCPGFSCNRPFARCLPHKRRCDRVADCLEAEDEINCPFFERMLHSLLGQQQETTSLPSTTRNR